MFEKNMNLSKAREAILNAKFMYNKYTELQYKVYAMKQNILYGRLDQAYYDDYKRLSGDLSMMEIEVIQSMNTANEEIDLLSEEDKTLLDNWINVTKNGGIKG